MEVLKWINENNGLMMAILTLVYVIATVVIMLLTYQSIAIGKRHLEHLDNLEKQRARPYVFFDIQCRERCIWGVLKNIGVTPAIDVSVEVNPPFVVEWGVGGARECALCGSKVGFLAPGRELADLVGVSHDFYTQHERPVFDVAVTYKDVNGSSYNEKRVVDLSFGEQMASPQNEVAEELRKIAKQLEALVQKCGI